MAAKKKSNRNTTKKNTSSKTSFRGEVILWCVLAFCILLFLSNFGIIGKVGNALSAVSFGFFGVLAYVFPIMLFLAVAFALSNRGERVATVKLIAAGLLLLFLDGLIQLITNKTEDFGPVTAFLNGFYNRAGGGFLGGIVTGIFCTTIGKVGAYVVTFAALIISVVLLTGRSAIGGIQKGSRKVYDTARVDAARYRSVRAERKQLRMEKKAAAGVSLDTALKKPADNRISDEITAIGDEEKLPAVGHHRKAAVRPVGEETASDAVQELVIHNHNELSEPTAVEDDVESELTDFSDEVASMMQKTSEPPREVKKRPAQSAAEQETQVATVTDEIKKTASAQKKKYQFPPLSLLSRGDKNRRGDSDVQLRETAGKLQQVLETFGVKATVTDVSCGPSVTRYELQPEMGVKVSRIVGLADDIKLNLAAADIRIEAPIPGKAAVGIEVPNKESVPVMFRELVEASEFKNEKSRIAFGAGKDISGKVIVADIAKMPHVLIAGATGSGKSVCINTIIMSILYRADPEDVKLIMIDPKVVELSVYNGIPHLLIPVVTDPKKAAGALNWAVQEMTDRYQKFAQYQVRKIEEYNAKVENLRDIEDENKPQKMPQIVVIVDELADLMMVAPGDVEDAICRLAQLARACGIHLVIATQRPSVNVITGLIKANMPSRIAFAVTSGVDSRTILDMVGAEKLLGKGDMLFYPQGYSKPLRVQGAFVSDQEVQNVVSFIKEQNGETVYDDEVVNRVSSASSANGGAAGAASLTDGNGSEGNDEYFTDAAKLIIDKEKASIGMLQRYFKIGFNRAARIMDQLEEAGVVGPEAGTKPREILMNGEQLENYLEENGG